MVNQAKKMSEGEIDVAYEAALDALRNMNTAISESSMQTPKKKIIIKRKTSTPEEPSSSFIQDKMEYSIIDISKYNKKFEDYPADFITFCKENDIKLPGIDTLRGQAYALMSQSDVRGKKYLTRTEAIKFFQQIGLETDDSIQPFNKTIGIKRMKDKKAIYCICYPFELDKTDIDKRKGCSISGDRDAQINATKHWWMENLVNVPNKDWQVGHLDPTIPDSSEKNLAFQPPIQAKYRNRFKWDPYFHKMWPTADECIKNMNDYYTEEEQRKLYDALKKKLNL